MKWEKSASRQNWWIGGIWRIVSFTVGCLAIWNDVSELFWKWILPVALSESSENKTHPATPTFCQFHALEWKCKNLLYEKQPKFTEISTPKINSTHLLHCETNITHCQRCMDKNIHTTAWHVTKQTAKEHEKTKYECHEIIIFIHAWDCLNC